MSAKVTVMTPDEAWENASSELRQRALNGECEIVGFRCQYTLTPEQLAMLERKGATASFVEWAKRALQANVAATLSQIT